ncbi:MAG: hypothetical protein BGN93_14405 [Acinetobacter sp. 39-4]|nr:MAG: hypothetical protein BGN93_14405 [Acinetobacter sp. 39-4]OJU89675.1 MAG: hypothetical protein BGO19_00565 [Acinetobacter sp. 38-8]
MNIMEYIPPKYYDSAFNCPMCNAYAQVSWSNLASKAKYRLDSGYCSHCGDASIWRRKAIDDGEYENNAVMLYPDTLLSIQPSVDMPENVAKDFNEARSIFSKSPRSSAALLRLALQKLCKHLGEPGKNINLDIGSLNKKDKLKTNIVKAADTIRIIGNNAVHPGEMDEQEVVDSVPKLFKLINLIVYSAITEPNEIDKLFESTPQGARDAIEKRDNQQK